MLVAIGGNFLLRCT